MTHICVSTLAIIGSDNGLSPGRRQAIILTNAIILLIGPLGTNFSEILIGIQTFSIKKMHLKMSFAKWRPFCLGLNVLTDNNYWTSHGLLRTKTHFTKALWVHNWKFRENIFSSCFATYTTMISYFHTYHDSSAVIAELLWHVQKYDTIWSLFFMPEQHACFVRFGF